MLACARNDPATEASVGGFAVSSCARLVTDARRAVPRSTEPAGGLMRDGFRPHLAESRLRLGLQRLRAGFL